MMLTFFTVAFLYINLKIVKNKMQINKKTKLELIIISLLGFLTQYFFAIYAAFVFLVMMILFIKRKEYKEMKKYIISLAISGIIGLLIFPFAINHMLFSDRRVSGFERGNILDRILKYIKMILTSFGSKWTITAAMLAIGIGAIIIKRKKERDIISLISVPSILFIVAISVLAEFLELRYAMNILPIIAIMIIIAVGSIFEKPKYDYLIAVCTVVLLLGYGFITETPLHLYKGYKNYIEISEKYKDDDLVYVGYTFFNHMQSMPEFIKYRKTFMIYNDQLEDLKKTEELNDKQEFILSVNETMKPQEVAKQITEITGFTDYELIFEGIEEVGQVIYRVYR